MDTLATLLDGPRAHGAFLLRAVLAPPWALRIQDEAHLTLVCMVRGDSVLLHESTRTRRRGPRPQTLAEGSVTILRGPDHYTLGDAPGTDPQVVVHPGQRCVTPDGEDLEIVWQQGVRTWGNVAMGDAEDRGASVMLIGTYETPPGERASTVGQRLLRVLPPVIHLEAGVADDALIPLLADEMIKELPGQEAVLDRMLDLLLIRMLRRWFERQDSEAPGWYRALSDPVVGGAVRLMESHPGRPWSLVSLAKEVGCSRATLARRFQDLVGEAPIGYLTRWRLELACDLLLDDSRTLATVADEVGYGSPFALSAAFKRLHGVSPKEWRARAVATPG